MMKPLAVGVLIILQYHKVMFEHRLTFVNFSLCNYNYVQFFFPELLINGARFSFGSLVLSTLHCIYQLFSKNQIINLTKI